MKLDSKKEIARGARSYMSRSDEENWDQLSEHEKKEAKEEINKNLGKKVKN